MGNLYQVLILFNTTDWDVQYLCFEEDSFHEDELMLLGEYHGGITLYQN